MSNHMYHTIAAGVSAYGFKQIVGNNIERHTFNYLGEKRGNFALIVVYVGLFFGISSFLDSR